MITYSESVGSKLIVLSSKPTFEKFIVYCVLLSKVNTTCPAKSESSSDIIVSVLFIILVNTVLTFSIGVKPSSDTMLNVFCEPNVLFIR